METFAHTDELSSNSLSPMVPGPVVFGVFPPLCHTQKCIKSLIKYADIPSAKGPESRGRHECQVKGTQDTKKEAGSETQRTIRGHVERAFIWFQARVGAE